MLVASARDDRYGSNTTRARRAALRNSAIIAAYRQKAHSPSADGADQEGNTRNNQRNPQVGKRLKRKVTHVPKRQSIRLRVLRESAGNIARRRQPSNMPENDGYRDSRNPRDNREKLGTNASPHVVRCHRATQQQRQRRIDRHRIVFLRSRKCEEHEYESRPTQR